ncbi:MAG: SMC-Scp complex subunit ScpB [Methylococcaceae bacterium]|nr:SMC-Scp complex subunit ScpB [Methylococcaceae bacterium]MCI0668617.1 SMC-Scp complex subunit ScpB [Methylococcaceae bacterium]
MDIKGIIEAVLFSADRPLDPGELQNCFPDTSCPDKSQIRAVLAEIREDYRTRAIELTEVSSGFRFQVRREYSAWVANLLEEKPPRYSRALLETLAIIAYQQPATRGQIEEIRGVSVSSTIIRTLLDRGWIRIVGHKEIPGRPALYATTRDFLDYFNLKSLADLPPLRAVQALDSGRENPGIEESSQESCSPTRNPEEADEIA